MKIERNEICSCGSGKKYKKCCLHIHQKEINLSKKNLSDHSHFTIELRPEVEKACDDALEILEKGDLSGAKKLAAPLILKYPNNHHVLFLQGVCFIQENRITDAIVSFENAVQIFPMFSEAFYNLASLYKISCDLSKCIHCLRQIIRFEGKSSSLRKIAENEIEELAKIIQTSNGISLDNYIQSEKMFNQAFTCLNEKKYEEAIFLFQQSLSLNLDHVQSYGNIALAYSGLGKNQTALEYLEKALLLDPNYGPALTNRQNIVLLREGEKLDAQIQEVRYYQMQVEKESKLGARLKPIKV